MKRIIFTLLVLSLSFSASANEIAHCLGESKNASEVFEVSIIKDNDSIWVQPSDRKDPRVLLSLWVPTNPEFVKKNTDESLYIHKKIKIAKIFRGFEQLLKIDFTTGEGIARYYDRHLPHNNEKEIVLHNCFKVK